MKIQGMCNNDSALLPALTTNYESPATSSNVLPIINHVLLMNHYRTLL